MGNPIVDYLTEHRATGGEIILALARDLAHGRKYEKALAADIENCI